MYTSKALIENFLGESIDSSLEDFVTLTINAIQSFIENSCGDEVFGKRVFEAPTVPQGQTEADAVRYFDGNGDKKIFIGEAVSITSIEVDGYAQVINSDFFLKPYNAIQIGKPYDTIELVQPSGNQSSRAKTIYDFTADQRNIKVTGKFRYSDTAPADIQLIATQLAGGVISEAISDGIKSETLGDYKIDYGVIVKLSKSLGVETILNNYKRRVPATNAGIRIAE